MLHWSSTPEAGGAEASQAVETVFQPEGLWTVCITTSWFVDSAVARDSMALSVISSPQPDSKLLQGNQADLGAGVFPGSQPEEKDSCILTLIRCFIHMK